MLVAAAISGLARIAGHVESLPDLLVIPYVIENRSTDLKQLQLLGEAATELQIPVLTSTSQAFLARHRCRDGCHALPGRPAVASGVW